MDFVARPAAADSYNPPRLPIPPSLPLSLPSPHFPPPSLRCNNQSAPTQTQRPQSLPLRRSAVNSISRRSKETLTLKSLLSGKSCSTSPPSKTGGASVSSARSKKGEGGAAPSATDFVRVMRTLLFLNRTASKSKGSVNEKETIIKPRRPSLDVSGHSFSKALKVRRLTFSVILCFVCLFVLFVFSLHPADEEKQLSRSPHFHVLSYTSCVDLSQLHSQSSGSWRVLRFPQQRYGCNMYMTI